ncbi:MAG: hypothetical protein QNJ14_13420 [Woeseiaceae bacterium]|nr:hypothetical protein [Woeseiaceae bacterium]
MKNGLSTLLAAALLLVPLLPSTTHAGAANAVIFGKSYHLESDRNWNENNSGLGIEYVFGGGETWTAIAMMNGFRDSTDNMSYMVGAGLHRRLYQSEQLAGFYVDVGLNAFFMTREDIDNNKPFPGILPSISLGTEKVGMNLTYIPRSAIESTITRRMRDPNLKGVLFVQFKVSIDQLLP